MIDFGFIIKKQMSFAGRLAKHNLHLLQVQDSLNDP